MKRTSTQSKNQSWPGKAALALSTGIIASVLSGCVDNSNDNQTEIDTTRVLVNAADNVIMPQYQAFNTAVSALPGQIQNYCAAIGTAGEASALENAKTTWLEAHSQWQQAEMYLVGPISSNDYAMRNAISIYSEAGSISPCGIDQATAQAELLQDPAFNITGRSASQRGLDSIEYLLFNNNLDHQCPPQITETTNWNTLSDLNKKTMRCDHAVTLANDITNTATLLHSEWPVNQGNYRSSFINSINASENIKALSDSLFYLDKEVKDLKLGLPLGLYNCSGFSCPGQLATPYADSSLELIRGNLLGFKAIFYGNGGYSFDDLLIEAGFPEIAAKYGTLADKAITVINNLQANNTTLRDEALAITDTTAVNNCANQVADPDSAPDSACKLYGYIQQISNSLRTEFVAIVNLDIPNRAQSDND